MNRSLVVALLTLLTGGCKVTESGKPTGYPANPFPEIKVVAVFPVRNQTKDAVFDGEEFANILASELAKFPGFRPLRPQMLREVLAPGEKGPSSVEEALNFGRRLKADAILACSVTDYDPYMPPRISVCVQFLRVTGRRLSGADIDRLVQSATWSRGSYPLSKDRAGHQIASFEGVYDAHEKRTRHELAQYAQAMDAGDTPFTEDGEFLAVQSRYLQFVSNRMIHRLLEGGSVDGP